MTSESRVANKRLANKVIWSLEDITAFTVRINHFLEIAYERSEERFPDVAMQTAILKAQKLTTQIQVLATAARHGEYAGQQRITDENYE